MTIIDTGDARLDCCVDMRHGGPPLVLSHALGATLERVAAPAPFAVWQWLTIRAGVPVVTAPVQDQLIAQTANLDVLGGVSFRKGCYTGQEIIARMQYLGKLKERLFAFHADVGDVAAASAEGAAGTASVTLIPRGSAPARPPEGR